MSYDLFVFEPGEAPVNDRLAFLAWFKQVVRLREGHLASDPAQTSPALRAWYGQMSQVFPHVVGGHAGLEDSDNFKADYRFAPHAVFARFEWAVSRKAHYHAMKQARLNSLGFFDASGETAAVYAFVQKRFTIAHAGDPLLQHAETALAAR